MALIAASSVAVAANTFPAITTTDGKTYDHITAQRTDPDGLYIEYTLPGNGLGCAKLKFNRLSADLQKEYGYDAEAAKKYEDENYKASLAFQAWADHQEAARQKARADDDARELQEEVMMARLAPRYGVPAAQASSDVSSPYDGGWSYGGYGAYGAYGRRAPLNSWTGSTFRGSVPQDRLFTPLGFSPTKTKVEPAAPRSTHYSGADTTRDR
jgi:hypothetical protein